MPWVSSNRLRLTSWCGPTDSTRVRVDHRNSGAVSPWQADRHVGGDDSERGLQRWQATAGTHQQTGEFVAAIPTGGGGPGGGTHQPGLETSVRTPGDASAQKHRQGCDGAQAGRSLVLDVAEWMCVLVVAGVRFVRGTARYRTWCEVEHRPLDWASRSLRRESEEVIVVEVLIEEMFRSGRNRPRDYETSRGRRADHPKQTRPLGGVNGEVCSKKI